MDAKTQGRRCPVPSEISVSPSPSPESHMGAYLSVLQNKSKFYSSDTKEELDITQLNQAVSSDSSVTAEVKKFAVVDLDKDNVPEVILSLAVNNDDYFGFEVLRYQDGVVNGYTLWYRSFMELKEDGTFSFSGGASDYGFGTIKFTEDGYTIDKITYCESGADTSNNETISYYVNGESATQEEFQSAISKQDEKPGVTWYDFTDDSIKTLFSGSAS